MNTLIHEQRLHLQNSLDDSKTHLQRNKLGQFATPPSLAAQIVESTRHYIGSNLSLRFLDPAFGTGAFFAALIQLYGKNSINSATGIEIDPHYSKPTQQFWKDTKLNLITANFTTLKPPDNEQKKANLIICNPPYVRHHHIDPEQKIYLKNKSKEVTGIQLSGLAGLYCYFMLIAHPWLANGGISCWLIPAEFLDVNYGKQIKQYLLTKVKLLRIHRFEPSNRQFEDALVSSAIVWFQNELPDPNGLIEFTFGEILEAPTKKQIAIHRQLKADTKWSKIPLLNKPKATIINPIVPHTKISDLFQIKRGIATGANKFFILTPDQILQYKLPSNFLIPILPSPRYLTTNRISRDSNGNPSNTKNLFLLDCHLPEYEVRENYPNLWKYLELGKLQGIQNRYLCRHRSPWYSQETRPPSPILCTYMGRDKKPFKFILNQSRATAPNVYLMLYPKPSLQKQLKNNPKLLIQIWTVLENIESDDLIREGRVYGGGLYKLEPKELGNTPIKGTKSILPEIETNMSSQLSLF